MNGGWGVVWLMETEDPMDSKKLKISTVKGEKKCGDSGGHIHKDSQNSMPVH